MKKKRKKVTVCRILEGWVDAVRRGHEEEGFHPFAVVCAAVDEEGITYTLLAHAEDEEHPIVKAIEAAIDEMPKPPEKKTTIQ